MVSWVIIYQSEQSSFLLQIDKTIWRINKSENRLRNKCSRSNRKRYKTLAGLGAVIIYDATVTEKIVLVYFNCLVFYIWIVHKTSENNVIFTWFVNDSLCRWNNILKTQFLITKGRINNYVTGSEQKCLNVN